MRKTAKNIFQLFFLVALALSSLTGLNAYAATPLTAEGCDPLVQKAQEARAQMRVAYDVAVAEEHFKKPDSTLSMTCFNNLAGIDASGSSGGGGSIFSGDFTRSSPSGNPGGLNADIQDSLQTFYTAFSDAMGADSGMVDYTQTGLANNPACNETQDLWDEVRTGGVEQGVPNATLTDLLNGTLPNGASRNYTDDWNTSNSTDNLNANYANALAAQPQPYNPTVVQTSTLCQAMVSLNIPGASCP